MNTDIKNALFVISVIMAHILGEKRNRLGVNREGHRFAGFSVRQMLDKADAELDIGIVYVPHTVDIESNLKAFEDLLKGFDRLASDKKFVLYIRFDPPTNNHLTRWHLESKE